MQPADRVLSSGIRKEVKGTDVRKLYYKQRTFSLDENSRRGILCPGLWILTASTGGILLCLRFGASEILR